MQCPVECRRKLPIRVNVCVEDILKVRTRVTAFDHLRGTFRETIYDMTEKKRKKKTKKNKETIIMARLHLLATTDVAVEGTPRDAY